MRYRYVRYRYVDKAEITRPGISFPGRYSFEIVKKSPNDDTE